MDEKNWLHMEIGFNSTAIHDWYEDFNNRPTFGSLIQVQADIKFACFTNYISLHES